MGIGRNLMPTDCTRKPGPGAHCPEKVKVNKPHNPTFSFGITHSDYCEPLILNIDNTAYRRGEEPVEAAQPTSWSALAASCLLSSAAAVAAYTTKAPAATNSESATEVARRS